MESTLKFTYEKDIKAEPGQAGKGHTIKRMTSRPLTSTERIEYIINEYEQGVREPLHWQITETAFYILSGHAEMKDINGKTYDLSPQDCVYAPAGISGAYSLEAKTKLITIVFDVWADVEGQGVPWIIVDEKTKMSTIDLENILKYGKTLFTPRD